jgi:hypothetical protein
MEKVDDCVAKGKRLKEDVREAHERYGTLGLCLASLPSLPP